MASRGPGAPAVFALLVAAWSLTGGGATAQGIRDKSEDRDDSKIAGNVPVVFAPQKKAILSSQILSSVSVIKKEMGQSFNEGDVLILLNDVNYKANVKKAEARLAAANAVFKAKERLFADNSTSSVELETARMEVLVAEASLTSAKKDLDDCTIKAPYPGRVVQVQVNEHELVQVGQQMIEILDDRIIRAQFLAPSLLFSRLKLGRELTFIVQETNEKTVGKISHVGGAIEPASSTVKVFAEIDNKDGKLKAGMRGFLDLASLTKEPAKDQ